MRLLLFMLAGLALLAHPAPAAEPASCRGVKLAQNDWTDVAATTAVASTLLRALGYAPAVATQPAPAIFQAMRQQRADAFLGVWLPAMAADLQPYLDDHSVTALGPNLTGAKYGLAVPDYLREAGLRDMSDIARFGAQLDHRILAIEPGNDGNLHLLDLIARNSFDLGGFRLVQSNPADMLAEVQKAVGERRPVVFLAWAPHWMNRDVKLSYLTGGEAVFGPDFGAATVYTDVRAGWPETCPNAARLLRNLTFTQAAVDDLMAARRLQHRAPERAAGDWLQANPGALAGWLDGVTGWDGKPAEPQVRARLKIAG